MKLTKIPATRTNVSIELTPDEQDFLFTLFGNLIGGGPIRDLTLEIWTDLQSVGAKEVSPKGRNSTLLVWG